jgi:O-antigen ligase
MLWLLMSVLMAFFIIYFVSIIPYPSKGEFNADFIERVSGNKDEPALASRWSLLPVLLKEIKKEPFLGQGYGATVTYFSQDPRILQNNPTGEYTTYAFEWGYLDLWLKIGLFGLLVYLVLIFSLIKRALILGSQKNNFILLGLSTALVFLALTNFFTPYLNHPLGIGILIIGACLIQENRVY